MGWSDPPTINQLTQWLTWLNTPWIRRLLAQRQPPPKPIRKQFSLVILDRRSSSDEADQRPRSVSALASYPKWYSNTHLARRESGQTRPDGVLNHITLACFNRACGCCCCFLFFFFLSVVELFLVSTQSVCNVLRQFCSKRCWRHHSHCRCARRSWNNNIR